MTENERKPVGLYKLGKDLGSGITRTGKRMGQMTDNPPKNLEKLGRSTGESLKNFINKGKGWHEQPTRHALASKGVKTTVDYIEKHSDANITKKREFKYGIYLPIKDGRNVFTIHNIQSIVKSVVDDDDYYVLEMTVDELDDRELQRTPDNPDTYIIFSPDRQYLEITDTRIDMSKAGSQRFKKILEFILNEDNTLHDIYNMVEDKEQRL